MCVCFASGRQFDLIYYNIPAIVQWYRILNKDNNTEKQNWTWCGLIAKNVTISNCGTFGGSGIYNFGHDLPNNSVT